MCRPASKIVRPISLLSLLVLLALASPAPGETLYVGGPLPESYATIAEALAVAADGDSIVVFPDYYAESIVVAKSVTLVAEASGSPVIDGLGIGDVIRIETSGVTISGLTIQGGGVSRPERRAGIHCTSGAEGVTVEGNIVRQSENGILLEGTAGASIVDNEVYSNGTGIFLVGATSATVERNFVRGNAFAGVLLVAASGNRIADNSVPANASGGILVREDSTGNEVSGNEISETAVGIWVTGSENEVSGNSVTASSTGISLGGEGSGNVIAGNEVHDCGGDAIQLCGVSNTFGPGNRVWGSRDGVRVRGPFHTIEGNVITGNRGDGVRITQASLGVTVAANPEISFNGGAGVRIDRTIGATVVDNTFERDGIVLQGVTLFEWTQHTITGNTSGGREIRYVVGEEDLVVGPGPAQVIVAGCSAVTLDGLVLDGLDLGIIVGYSSDVVVTGCELWDCDEGLRVDSSDSVIVAQTLVRDNEETGITLSGCTGVVLDGVTSRGNGLDGIRVVGSTDVTAVGCLVESNQGRGIAVLEACTGITLSGDTIENNRLIGVNAEGSLTDFVLEMNEIRENDDGVVLKTGTGGRISGNTIEANHLYGLKLTGNTSSVVIETNTIVENRAYFGVRLCGDHCTLTENTIVGNGEGILLCGSENVIRDNSIDLHRGDGIFVRYDATSNSIRSNTIEHCGRSGIVIEGSTNDIADNTIRFHLGDGIVVVARSEAIGCPEGNVLHGNRFSEIFGRSVSLDALSRENLLQGNQFLGSRVSRGSAPLPMVWDEGRNLWDGGAVLGGNFWCDYLGVDSDGDGFGDAPRRVPGPAWGEGASADRHPLMAPPSIAGAAPPAPATRVK